MLSALLLFGNVFYTSGGKLRAKKGSKYLHAHHPSANDGTSIEELHQSRTLFLHRKCDPMLPSVCQVNQTRASSKNALGSWKTNEINPGVGTIKFPSYSSYQRTAVTDHLSTRRKDITTGYVYLNPLLEMRLRLNPTNSTAASPRISIGWYQCTKIPTTNHGSLRTQIDFSRVLNFTLTPALPRSQC